MKKAIKWVIIIIGSGLLLYVVLFIYTILAFGFIDEGKFYSKQDLINNYNQKTPQIAGLKTYINKIVPANGSVYIEFNGNNRLDIFHVFDKGSYDRNWNLAIESKKVDTLLIKLGWTRQTLTALKEKLDGANCISVKNGEPCNIGFQRSGMGKYYYNLFDKSIPDSLKSKFNDGCTYILYKDKVVLEYGGGAIGPQCFPTN
jgi:hypothetical protein